MFVAMERLARPTIDVPGHLATDLPGDTRPDLAAALPDEPFEPIDRCIVARLGIRSGKRGCRTPVDYRWSTL